MALLQISELSDKHVCTQEFCICIPCLQTLILGVWSRIIIKSRGRMAICECKHDARDSRCSISSAPGGDPFLVRASNSNAGSISRSSSHKCWISHTRWDGDILNKYKELNWYTAHCHCGRCIDEVLHLNSNGIPAKTSISKVSESAVVLIVEEIYWTKLYIIIVNMSKRIVNMSF